MNEPARQTTREDYTGRITRVQRHIFEHLDEALPLSELAAIACFSLFHFGRVFAAMTGETPGDFIRRLRIERAASQLTGGASVAGAAEAAGYDAPEAFSRAFHEHFGMPPATYRQHHFDGQAAGAVPEFTFTIKLVRQAGVHMDVKIQKLGPYRVAFVRHVGPYDQCEAAWKQLMSDRRVLMQFRPGTICFSLCYDSPEKTAPGEIRSDICVTTGKGFQPAGGIEAKDIPAAEYATLRHTGPYSGLNACYKYLYGEWLPASGREPDDDPCMEIYRNNPARTPPHKLVTDICVPLKQIAPG